MLSESGESGVLPAARSRAIASRASRPAMRCASALSTAASRAAAAAAIASLRSTSSAVSGFSVADFELECTLGEMLETALGEVAPAEDGLWGFSRAVLGLR